MPLIIQNTTQDMLRLSPDEIMYIQSDGNYCQLWLYGCEAPVQLWVSLKAVSEMIDMQMRGLPSVFVRIGKQHVLNISYIHRIDLKKNLLTMWRKGMDKPVVLDAISHKALSALADGLSKNMHDAIQ